MESSSFFTGGGICILHKMSTEEPSMGKMLQILLPGRNWSKIKKLIGFWTHKNVIWIGTKKNLKNKEALHKVLQPWFAKTMKIISYK